MPCSRLLFGSVIRTATQTTWEGKFVSSLIFQAHSLLREFRVRTLGKVLGRNCGGMMLTHLLLLPCAQPSFLYNPGSAAHKWHYPYWEGSSHVNFQSRQFPTDMAPGYSELNKCSILPLLSYSWLYQIDSKNYWVYLAKPRTQGSPALLPSAFFASYNLPIIVKCFTKEIQQNEQKFFWHIYNDTT